MYIFRKLFPKMEVRNLWSRHVDKDGVMNVGVDENVNIEWVVWNLNLDIS